MEIIVITRIFCKLLYYASYFSKCGILFIIINFIFHMRRLNKESWQRWQEYTMDEGKACAGATTALLSPRWMLPHAESDDQHPHFTPLLAHAQSKQVSGGSWFWGWTGRGPRLSSPLSQGPGGRDPMLTSLSIKENTADASELSAVWGQCWCPPVWGVPKLQETQFLGLGLASPPDELPCTYSINSNRMLLMCPGVLQVHNSVNAHHP